MPPPSGPPRVRRARWLGRARFCSSQKSSSTNGILLDTSDAWDPDGAGDLAAVCPLCKTSHWTIPFVTYTLEYDLDFEDGIIMMGPDNVMAQKLANLEAIARRAAAEPENVSGPKAVVRLSAP
ncbi:MAG: hypothetical protein M3S32_04440 [Acidobacteriota bacterium]|nr:hypothetical protein [Acidobacteriota bacterium]